MIPKVTILSRPDAINYCHSPHDVQSIIISISTPFAPYSSAPFVSTENRVKNILSLAFEDADARDGGMVKKDAEAICRFIQDHAGTPEIIVHCDGGKSRSAGIAAAIMHRFTGDGSEILKDPQYKPNMHCYHTTVNTWMS